MSFAANASSTRARATETWAFCSSARRNTVSRLMAILCSSAGGSAGEFRGGCTASGEGSSVTPPEALATIGAGSCLLWSTLNSAQPASRTANPMAQQPSVSRWRAGQERGALGIQRNQGKLSRFMTSSPPQETRKAVALQFVSSVAGNLHLDGELPEIRIMHEM